MRQKLNQFRLSEGEWEWEWVQNGHGLRQFVALCGPFSPSSAGETVCECKCVNVCSGPIKANVFTHSTNSFINNNQGGQNVEQMALTKIIK